MRISGLKCSGLYEVLGMFGSCKVLCILFYFLIRVKTASIEILLNCIAAAFYGRKKKSQCCPSGINLFQVRLLFSTDLMLKIKKKTKRCKKKNYHDGYKLLTQYVQTAIFDRKKKTH